MQVGKSIFMSPGLTGFTLYMGMMTGDKRTPDMLVFDGICRFLDSPSSSQLTAAEWRRGRRTSFPLRTKHSGRARTVTPEDGICFEFMNIFTIA